MRVRIRVVVVSLDVCAPAVLVSYVCESERQLRLQVRQCKWVLYIPFHWRPMSFFEEVVGDYSIIRYRNDERIFEREKKKSIYGSLLVSTRAVN